MAGSSDPAHPRAERWARLEHHDRTSALFVDTSDTGVLLCRSCRSLRRCRLGIGLEQLTGDGSVRSEIVCPQDQEGGPHVAHGGWTASVLDEMSGHAVLLRDEFAVTGTLTVAFVKPIPILRPLIGRAWIASREGRQVHVHGELRLADTGDVVATSEAVMIRRPGDHFDRHQRWLASRGPGLGSSE
jgi:acyl-coenzyme A thioesterase PaaI-like protein